MIWPQHLSTTRPRLSFVRQARDKRPTLLLLHGVTRLWRDWEPVLAGLTAFWNIAALDHRGHGESERASSYFVTDYVADAVAFLRTDIGEPVTILGHSLGAMVAAAVAAEVPEYVKALVLEDPPFETMGTRIIGTAWQAQFKGMQTAVCEAAKGGDLAGLLADIAIPQMDGTLKTLAQIRSKAALEWSANCLRSVDPGVFTPLIEGRWLQGYDRHRVFGAIECPTLLMQADSAAGGALTDADTAEAVSLITGCQHVRFAGANHQLHRDHANAFLSALGDFALQYGFHPH